MANTAAKTALIECTSHLHDACDAVAAAKSSLWIVMLNHPEGSKEINPNDMVQFNNAYAQISTLLPQMVRAMMNLDGLIAPIK